MKIKFTKTQIDEILMQPAFERNAKNKIQLHHDKIFMMIDSFSN